MACRKEYSLVDPCRGGLMLAETTGKSLAVLQDHTSATRRRYESTFHVVPLVQSGDWSPSSRNSKTGQEGKEK